MFCSLVLRSLMVRVGTAGRSEPDSESEGKSRSLDGLVGSGGLTRDRGVTMGLADLIGWNSDSAESVSALNLWDGEGRMELKDSHLQQNSKIPQQNSLTKINPQILSIRENTYAT